MPPRRVGIIGYGVLGKYLVSQINADPNHELSFVWNRTRSVLEGSVDSSLILNDLNDFAAFSPDIVVEVAHPDITKTIGKLILQHCDYMIGSPTALSDIHLLNDLLNAAANHSIYIPSGAFWGAEDIKKMSDSGGLKSLKVTMAKHPSSLKLEGYLKEKNAVVTDKAVTLYQGCVRGVCGLAPNNTNIMAVAALAAQDLGFDGVIGCLISDPDLLNYHIIEIEAYGHPNSDGSCFHVHTIRKNPAAKGSVTGQATLASLFQSLKRAQGKRPGLQMC